MGIRKRRLQVAAYIDKKFGIQYSIRGVTSLLHRLDYTYKKPKHIPGKANKESQEEFIESYHKLKQEKASEDQIYFVDGVHPMHNSQPAYGWMRKDHDYTIQSNTGRSRININGAVNLENMRVIFREDDTIDSESAINLFKQILEKQIRGKVYVILDNARYYKSKLVAEFVESNPRLELVFLPPYSPNLNIIERLWKFMRKNVTYNKYYEKYALFRKVLINFLENIDQHRDKLRSLLTDNFEILHAN